MVIDTDCIGSGKSNNHTITTMTAPVEMDISQGGGGGGGLEWLVFCAAEASMLPLSMFFLLDVGTIPTAW